jgi:K(+)-stimulated pyrophosphate-energized sodium pump
VLITVVSLLSLAFAYSLWKEIKRFPLAEGEMIEYSLTVRKGVLGFLRGQKKFCFSFSAIISIVFLFFLGPGIAFGFLFGILISMITGCAVTIILSESSLKLAGAADQNPASAARIALKGGWAVAFGLVGLALFFLANLFFLTSDLRVLIALGLGSALISILIKLGSNIYREAISIRTDQESVQSENAAKKTFLFCQVGDNLKDLAGIINFLAIIIIFLTSAMILGKLSFPFHPAAVVLPLFLISVAILAVVISASIVSLLKNKSGIFVFYSFLILAWSLFVLGSWLIIPSFGRNLQIASIELGWPIFLGLAVVAFIATISFLADKDDPSLAVGNQPVKRKETLVRLINLRSRILLPLTVIVGLTGSYFIGGLYGLALGIATIFSLLILIVILFSRDIIIRDMTNLARTGENRLATPGPESFGGIGRKAVDFFLVNSIRLSVLLLFLAYFLELRNFGRPIWLLLGEVKVWLGLLFGTVIIYCFIVLLKVAVEKTILIFRIKMEEELKRSELDSDCQDCFDSLAEFDFKEIFWPVLFLIVAPVIIGFIFGASVLAGLLSGSVLVGAFLATPFRWSGVVWTSIEKNVRKINRQDWELPDKRKEKDFYRWIICSAIGILNIVSLLIVSFLNF